MENADDKTANADGFLRSLARKRNHQHQTQAETHKRHAGTAVTLRPAAPSIFKDIDHLAGPLDIGRRALKALGIDFGRRSHTLLDHGNSLANLKLTHTGSGHGHGDEEHPEPRNHRDRNHKDHEIVQTPSRETRA